MAKRISSSSVNWTFVIEGFKGDMTRLTALKNKSDKYLRMIAAQPAELPKIDWSLYKSKITIPGMVDTFQKNYEGMKIPSATDQGFFSLLDKEEQEFTQIAKDDKKYTLELVAEYKAKLVELEKLIPFSEMSIEEFIIANPEYSFDPKNPKIWPQFIDTDMEPTGKISPPKDH